MMRGIKAVLREVAIEITGRVVLGSRVRCLRLHSIGCSNVLPRTLYWRERGLDEWLEIIINILNIIFNIIIMVLVDETEFMSCRLSRSSKTRGRPDDLKTGTKVDPAIHEDLREEAKGKAK